MTRPKKAPAVAECPWCLANIPTGILSAMSGADGAPGSIEEWGIQRQYHTDDCRPYLELGEALIPHAVWDLAGRVAVAALAGDGPVYLPVTLIEAIPGYDPDTYLGAVYFHVRPLLGEGTFVVRADDVHPLDPVPADSLATLAAAIAPTIRALRAQEDEEDDHA